MRSILLTGFLTLAPVALAQAPAMAPPDEAPNAQRWEEHKAERVAAITQAVGLDDAGSQRLKATFASFESRQRALHQQMKAQGQIIHQAAAGDATALGQLEGAINQMRSLRQQGEQMHDEMFQSLSQGLSPQQKAKLLLALRPGEGHHHGRGGRGR